jgi:hypothetical protein
LGVCASKRRPSTSSLLIHLHNIQAQEFIQDATIVDRSGLAVLEFILRSQDKTLSGFSNIGLRETFTVGCWYLWWMRRPHTHNESVPPIHHYRMLALSIMTTASKAMKKPKDGNHAWSKQEIRQIKINVDGSFHIDDRAGSVGAMARDHNGRFLVASSLFIPNIVSSVEA